MSLTGAVKVHECTECIACNRYVTKVKWKRNEMKSELERIESTGCFQAATYIHQSTNRYSLRVPNANVPHFL